jgi:predicted Zn-dependent peptidase
LRAGVTNTRVEEVVSEMLKELDRLKTELVSDEELAKTKEYLASHMRMGLESSNAWAGWYGGEDVMGKKLETPAEKEKALRAVTAAQIKKTCFKDFCKEKSKLGGHRPKGYKRRPFSDYSGIAWIWCFDVFFVYWFGETVNLS